MTKDDYIFYEYNHKYSSAKVFMIFYLGGKSMDLNEFYQSMNVDFHIVLQRLLRKNLILKYFQMFLNDDSFANLQEAMNSHDGSLAFRSAHTLKGLCLNLEFQSVFPMLYQLTDALRGNEVTIEAEKLFEEFSHLYFQLIHNIQSVLETESGSI